MIEWVLSLSISSPQVNQSQYTTLTVEFYIIELLLILGEEYFRPAWYRFQEHHTGADPGFFPRGGPVGHRHIVTETPQASQGKVRRGVWGASPKKIWNMKCSRSDSEQTWGTLEIFSRAIFLGTLLQFCENSVFSD